MNLIDKIDNFLNESTKKPKITLYTDEFEKSHHKKPSGYAVWTFEVEQGDEQDPEIAPLLKGRPDILKVEDNLVTVKFSRPYNEALNIIKKAIINTYPETSHSYEVSLFVVP